MLYVYCIHIIFYNYENIFRMYYTLINHIFNKLIIVSILYYIYIVYFIEEYIYLYCLCGSVAKASGTQAVGHGFDPRPDH